MLYKIKSLLGLTDNSKDELLLVLIESAIEEAINYTNNPEVTIGCESTICEMVVYRFNRLGTEGVDSESYSGVNFHYSTDYPTNILRKLNSKRKLRVVND